MESDKYNSWLSQIYSECGVFEVETSLQLGAEEPINFRVQLSKNLKKDGVYKAYVSRRDCYKLTHSFSEESADETIQVEDIFLWDEGQTIEASSIEGALDKVLAHIDSRFKQRTASVD